MKRTYINPAVKVVDLSMETGILSASNDSSRFEVGISQEEMNGADALSNSKHEIWESETIWK